jgi:hypothetical protein
LVRIKFLSEYGNWSLKTYFSWSTRQTDVLVTLW